MNGPDDEFDDFLSRRKPLFRRPVDELQPPEEIDRVVLRRAREAIEIERPQRAFRGANWGAPLAIAATLLVVFTVVLHFMQPSNKVVPDVSVQQVAQPVAGATAPAWRNDSQTWLAHIEKLRAEGRHAEADAELAAFKREHRALAVDPNR
ncbi:MAG TPA: hypothetical protein VFZ95_13285 [Steroidobacteraceae bacterium]